MSNPTIKYASFIHRRAEPVDLSDGPSTGTRNAAAGASKAAKKGRASADSASATDHECRPLTRQQQATLTATINEERARRAAGWWPEAEYTPMHLFADPETNEALREKTRKLSAVAYVAAQRKRQSESMRTPSRATVNSAAGATEPDDFGSEN